MEEKTVRIPAISCGHCIMTIERELGELEGVSYVKGNAGTREVTVKWNAPMNWDTILETLDEIGYSPDEIKSVP